jgi:hypothetical protein
MKAVASASSAAATSTASNAPSSGDRSKSASVRRFALDAELLDVGHGGLLGCEDGSSGLARRESAAGTT